MEPSTTVITILFTDIEGSTRLWEQEGERMSGALARHDVLARTAVEGNRGAIVKTTGDGIYAAFEEPLDALNATVALQQSLADPATTNGIPIRVRCGLHLGEVERRDNDYLGNPVNRTARIMSVAHGGQILLSQAVVDSVGQRLPPPIELRDLGNVRLKDLSAPEHVYQVVHPELRQDFPALRSLETTPNNLPQLLTSFVGRERELGEATALLKKTRLLTLLGMGGLGKTRLSMQIGADVMDEYPDGLWFVDLAPLQDPTLVASETANALGVREEPGRPLMQTLCAHLKSRKLVIILDNCEHLVAPSAKLANELLRAAPDIRIIATSREALHVPGEQVYPVSPLPVPDRTASFEVLSRSAAVQLFVERAQLHKPSFALTEREAPGVAELVARLEGIPLALELAAARVRSLSIADINTRLRDRYKLLTGGGRVLLERQQTLRALVDWSYDLLNENERILLSRLSVFAGAFDLAASEEVCGADPLLPEDILDLVTSLVEKSLVSADDHGETVRYRMLETIRDYGREKLTQRDEHAATATRHCNYFLALAKASNEGLQGPDQAEWMRRVEADLDDLRAAIALALGDGGDPIIAVKLEVALLGFWMLRGYSTEGRNYVRAALALPAVQESNMAHAHALYVGAVLAHGQGDHVEALRMLEACLALRRGLGKQVDIAATLSTLSLVRMHVGDAERARQSEEEAVNIFRELKDRRGEAIGLVHLGQICAYFADNAQARGNFEQSLAIGRAIKNQEIESECELLLGEVALDEGDLPAARQRFERSLAVCRNAEIKRGEATALWRIGKVDLEGGDHDAARTRLGGALRAFRAFEMNEEMLGCLEDHAALVRSQGAPDDAARLYACAATYRERLSLPRAPLNERRWQVDVSLAREALGEAGFEAAWAEGHVWEIDEAIRRALASAAAEVAIA